MATDFMKLKATLSLDSDQYEKGMSKSERLAKGFGKAFKVGAVAIGAAATAVGVLVKKSVDAYGEYEQLAGGVKKLFGEEASAEVMKYANDAYKTAGMSANQYMEQATQFSAALINSLGDQSAAAKQTDVAMRAISDNYNTFGGDIQNVQNAFQGFAKGQFNMLDNLRLGYGGTRGEMERLIADANEYAKANGMAADLSIDSFSDIVTAIDLVQQKQGIAGTTAAEAASTIQGSLNMTKAAWQNLVAGFANPDADLGQLMDNLVIAIVGDKQGKGLLNQIVPAIQNALKGIASVLQKAAPIFVEQFPTIIQNVLPPLIEAAATLIAGLVAALPSLIKVLVKQMPMVVKTLAKALASVGGQFLAVGKVFISNLASGISSAFAGLKSKVASLAKQIPIAIKNGVGSLVNIGSNIIEGLWSGIKAKFDRVISKVKSLASGLPKAVKKVLGIASPSKVFRDQIGKNIALGMALGIEDGEDAVSSAMRGLNGEIIGSVPDMISTPSIDMSIVDTDTTSKGLSYMAKEPKTATFYNTIYVNGAEDPEIWADRLVRQMQLDMRMA